MRLAHVTQMQIVALTASVLAAGCDMPGRPKRSERPLPANEITDFAVLYRTNCSGCHGAGGTLGPAPPLDDAIFLSIVPDEELLKTISDGRPGTPMPGFAPLHGGPLTVDQVRVLAQGIKPRWQAERRSIDEERIPDGLPPYALSKPDDAITADTRARGLEVFSRACEGCHGERGEGGGAGAIHDRAFLALISDQAPRRTIITGRPDLGMPNFAATDGRADDFKPLSSADIDDLVALIASWRSDESGTASAAISAGNLALLKTVEAPK